MSSHDEPWVDPVTAGMAISEQLSTIHTESYETPVIQAITHVLDDLVVTVLDIELSVIETADDRVRQGQPRP